MSCSQRLVYYDVDQFGDKIQLTTTSVFSAVQGAQASTIAYKNSQNVIERMARVSYRHLIASNVF